MGKGENKGKRHRMRMHVGIAVKGSGETSENITVIETKLCRELHSKMETNNEQTTHQCT